MPKIVYNGRKAEMAQHDVVIVGGGPSGLYTARLLAEKGLSVAVLEKKHSIGEDVVCTGIVNSEIFDEYDIPRSAETGLIQAVRMVGPTGEEILYRHPKPFAVILDRQSFDREMAVRAVAAGAEVVTGTEVVDLARVSAGVEIRTTSNSSPPRTWRARMAVLATGCHHRLHGRIGLKPPRRMIFGAQAVIPGAETGETAIFIGKNHVRGGFAWSVPAGSGRCKVGLLTHEPPREAIRKFASARFPGGLVDGSFSSLGIKPISHGMAARSVSDRFLALGEAAGQVKTTTGGGIAYGLLGARLAVEAIVRGFECGTLDEGVLSSYERRWKSLLRREISIGLWAWRIYAWLSESQLSSLFTLARTDGIIPLIQRQGDFDWQSGLIIDLIRKTSVFDYFKGLSSKPSSLERMLN